jgi:hypothetical protein
VVFCFSKSKDAEAFAKRFGGELVRADCWVAARHFTISPINVATFANAPSLSGRYPDQHALAGLGRASNLIRG